MENISVLSNKEAQMNLPPGFRFHPTDEELITYYLFNKATRENFSAIAIAEVDIHKSEPWDLPWKAKMGDDKWYFCFRGRKYQSSLRANRTTEAGYWKSTGRDGEIYRGKWLIGKKKTLVFYSGRAPTGEKTDWVMHEYRLDGKLSVTNSSRTNEWVICRVYQKASGGKKTHISGIKRLESTGNGLGSSVSVSPPVVCYTPCYKGTVEPTMISNDPAYVSCFSSLPHFDQNDQAGIFNSAGNTLLGIRSNPQESVPRNLLHGWLYSSEPIQAPMNLPLPDSALTVQEQNFLDGVLENNGGFITEAEKMTSVSHETDPTTTDMNPDMSSVMSTFDNLQNPASSAASLDLDHFWSY